MDAPKKLCYVNCGLPVDQCDCYRQSLDATFLPTILATEHDRMMAEKGAEIAMLRAERDRWHADANLMLGFADLAYDVGACPTSSELIAARDRVVATISNAAFEDAARMVDCACECRDAVLAAKTKVERWNACGRDPCGALDAADIRALKGWKE